jgi:hypothetical protein
LHPPFTLLHFPHDEYTDETDVTQPSAALSMAQSFAARHADRVCGQSPLARSRFARSKVCALRLTCAPVSFSFRSTPKPNTPLPPTQ